MARDRRKAVRRRRRKPKWGSYRQVTRVPDDPRFAAAYDQGLEPADEVAEALDEEWERRGKYARRSTNLLLDNDVLMALERMHDVLMEESAWYQCLGNRSPRTVLKMAVAQGLRAVQECKGTDRVETMSAVAWIKAKRSINRAHAKLRKRGET